MQAQQPGLVDAKQVVQLLALLLILHIRERLGAQDFGIHFYKLHTVGPVHLECISQDP